MRSEDLLHHVFPWEVAPGIPREDATAAIPPDQDDDETLRTARQVRTRRRLGDDA